jgi:hypothetical protein
MAPGSLARALPTTLAGRVNLPAAESGEAGRLAANAQIALVAPGGEVVAVTPLSRDGSFRFEGLRLTQTGEYALRVFQSGDAAEVTVDDLVIVLTEDGTWLL